MGSQDHTITHRNIALNSAMQRGSVKASMSRWATGERVNRNRLLPMNKALQHSPRGTAGYSGSRPDIKSIYQGMTYQVIYMYFEECTDRRVTILRFQFLATQGDHFFCICQVRHGEVQLFFSNAYYGGGGIRTRDPKPMSCRGRHSLRHFTRGSRLGYW